MDPVWTLVFEKRHEGKLVRRPSWVFARNTFRFLPPGERGWLGAWLILWAIWMLRTPFSEMTVRDLHDDNTARSPSFVTCLHVVPFDKNTFSSFLCFPVPLNAGGAAFSKAGIRLWKTLE